MAAGVGNKIEWTDYNQIRSLIVQVLGTGSGDYGYGQDVSALTAVAQNEKITVAQWDRLRTAILKARQHQTTAALSLTQPTSSVKLYELDRSAYYAMAQDAATNRLAIPPAPEATREDLVTSTQRTTAWNGTISQTITVDFASADAARYYFNTGSRFEFSASLTGGNTGVPGTKDNSWAAILSGMGVIYFNRSNTTCTGSGNTTSIGWASLTSSNQLIFRKDVSGTTYYPNAFYLYARAPSASQIVFTLNWQDDSGNPNPPLGTDENVTGTLTSYAQVYRASGSNVSVNKPSATKTTF